MRTKANPLPNTEPGVLLRLGRAVLLSPMLWCDNDPDRDLDVRLQRAARHYERKFGRAPNLCLAHPKTVGLCARVIAGITCHADRTLLPEHFWVGLQVS